MRANFMIFMLLPVLVFGQNLKKVQDLTDVEVKAARLDFASICDSVIKYADENYTDRMTYNYKEDILLLDNRDTILDLTALVVFQKKGKRYIGPLTNKDELDVRIISSDSNQDSWLMDFYDPLGRKGYANSIKEAFKYIKSQQGKRIWGIVRNSDSIYYCIISFLRPKAFATRVPKKLQTLEHHSTDSLFQFTYRIIDGKNWALTYVEGGTFMLDSTTIKIIMSINSFTHAKGIIDSLSQNTYSRKIKNFISYTQDKNGTWVMAESYLRDALNHIYFNPKVRPTLNPNLVQIRHRLIENDDLQGNILSDLKTYTPQELLKYIREKNRRVLSVEK